MKVSVAMLGSRNHYAIPFILNKAGLLEKFYTDSYIGNKPLLESILRLILRVYNKDFTKKWLTRKHDGINSNRVKSNEIWGIKYAIERKRAVIYAELERVFVKFNRKFCNWIIKELQNERNLPDAFYGFNRASYELFEYLKEKNIITILEQTLIPHKLEYEIINDEIEKWKGWEKVEIKRNVNSELCERELKEYELSDYIIAPSAFVKTGLINLGVPSYKIILIPYGIDTSQFSYKRKIFKNRPLKIVFMGEVGLRKGVPYLLEAVKKLGKKNVHLKLAGSVSLKQEIISRYLDCAEFLGHKPKSEILSLLYWADVFILPSLAEGSAISTYEALATGLPVITTPNAGTLVENEKTGIIIESASVEAIQIALTKLLENPELVEQYSQNAYNSRWLYDISRYERDILNFVLCLKRGFRDKINTNE